ncbi:hypothetical protein IAU59_001390 [Kwoniella sp. CBS 9459]
MLIKRELNLSSESEDERASGSSTLAPGDSISADEKPSLKRIKASPNDKSKSKSTVGKDGKGTKTPRSTQEDAALIDIMDDLIKKHLWPAIKASNNSQLIARTSYGCKYHAKLLMKEQKTSSPKK